jgi:hypothetical protein
MTGLPSPADALATAALLNADDIAAAGRRRAVLEARAARHAANRRKARPRTPRRPRRDRPALAWFGTALAFAIFAFLFAWVGTWALLGGPGLI